jgi:hypothetical protein
MQCFARKGLGESGVQTFPLGQPVRKSASAPHARMNDAQVIGGRVATPPNGGQLPPVLVVVAFTAPTPESVVHADVSVSTPALVVQPAAVNFSRVTEHVAPLPDAHLHSLHPCAAGAVKPVLPSSRAWAIDAGQLGPLS